MSSTIPLSLPRKVNPGGWLLSLLAEVRPGESAVVLMLSANIFLTLASYYVLKTVREALILSEGGAVVKSYSAAAQALILLIAVPLYGAIASRVRRTRLLPGVTLFFVSHLILFYALASTGFHIGTAFYVWLGIFNVLAIAQFWSFANDIYQSEQGERLFPIIGVGSAVGAWAGSTLAARLFASFSAEQLILIGAAGFLGCAAITFAVNRRLSPTEAKSRVPGNIDGFQLVLRSRYLIWVAAMIVVLNIVNSTGEFMLGRLIVDNAKQAIAANHLDPSKLKSLIGQSYGSFFGWVNLLGLALQVFVTAKIFRSFGVRAALFVLPVIAFGSYSLMAAFPILGAVRFAKILENSVDYSIQNTARHALFLPVNRDEKYKAKAAIDTFFWRLGDVLQAGVVAVVAHFAISLSSLAMVNLLLVCVWLAAVVAIARHHRGLYEPR